MKFRAIDNAGNDLVHVVGRTHVLRNDAVEFFRIKRGRYRRCQLYRTGFRTVKRGNNVPHDQQCMLVIVRHMVHYAGLAAVQVAAAQILGGDVLAGCRLHQRRSGKEDRTLIAHDHCLIAHGGNIRAAGCAASHHARDLGDALGRHLRLIVEQPAEMIPVRKNLGLMRQVRAA